MTNLRDLSGRFDLILDIGCYHGLTENERAAYRANLERFLAPGGSFLLYAHRASQPGIDEGDVAAFARLLTLSNRVDSTERGIRPSVWLHFISA